MRFQFCFINLIIYQLKININKKMIFSYLCDAKKEVNLNSQALSNCCKC